MKTTWILEARAEVQHGRDEGYAGAPWLESACGSTGPGYTQFDTYAAAEAARRGLVELREGWSNGNTRVRAAEVAS